MLMNFSLICIWLIKIAPPGLGSWTVSVLSSFYAPAMLIGCLTVRPAHENW